MTRSALDRARSALNLVASADAAQPSISLVRMLRRQLGECDAHEDDERVRKATNEAFTQLGLNTRPDSGLSLPWSALSTRAMSTSAGSAGGYLAPAMTASEAVDILRPFSVTARLGITILDGLTGSSLTLPRTTGKATATWQAGQGVSVSAADAALGAVSLTTKTLIGIVEVSQQLLRQASGEDYIRRELRRTLGTAVDAAVLNGAGGSEPLGILKHSGLQTQSGTTLGQAGLANMLEQCATNNANDDGIAFVTTPPVRELLQTRERATGSGIVWDRGTVVDKPAFVTTDMPAATMIAGDWSDVVVGLWGPGFQVDVQHADFNKATLAVRVMAFADVAVLHPTAWCVSTSIT